MTQGGPRIAIRADAAHWIGFGHIARCATLADRLRDQGARVTFLSRDLPGHYNDWLEQQGYPVYRLPAPESPADDAWLGVSLAQDIDDCRPYLESEASWDWLVVDHYGLGREWEHAARPFVRRILVIDDLADRHHDCDLLLDQNLQPAPGRYAGLVPPACRLLLGPRFALLRPEFAALHGATPTREGALRRLLIFMGGNDSARVTQKALAGLSQTGAENLAIDVVIGKGNPHRDEIAAQCAQLPQARLHVQTPTMACLMAAADLMLGAAGTTSWERCCLGLPALVASVAPNQRDNGRQTARQRVAVYLGDAETLGPTDLGAAIGRLADHPGLLRRMSARARALVDGRGALRVTLAMGLADIGLGEAVAADCDLIWKWRNDPRTRRNAFSTDAISLDSHRQWFARTLANPDRHLLLGHVGRERVGVLRFDRLPEGWEISVYLDPNLQGLGLGPRLIAAGSRWLAATADDPPLIVARVRPENTASRRAFLKAGFVPESPERLLWQPSPAALPA